MQHLDEHRLHAALTGPGGSIRTPFHRDGSIDFDGLRRIIDANLAGGSPLALLTAGDSHFFCLTDAEISEVTKATVAHNAGRGLVVAADRQYDTARAVDFARFLRDTGVDMYMVLPPDWGKSLTPESLTNHYAAIAAEIPIMIVTNLFIPRGIDFALETLRLCLDRLPGPVALKDDMCGEAGARIAELVHPKWAVWSGGLMRNHITMHPHGCDGYLCALATFQPKTAAAYWSCIQEDDLTGARQIMDRHETPFFNAIKDLPGGFDAGMHAMLEICGLAERWRRPPYHSLTDAEMDTLKNNLKGQGFGL